MSPDPNLKPEPGVVSAIAGAQDDVVVAELLRRLALEPDRWAELLRDLAEMSDGASAEALRSAANEIAPMPTPAYWEGQRKRLVMIAQAMLDAGMLSDER